MKPTKAHLKKQEELVRRFVNEWDPVGLLACGAPDDEYDCITHRVLSALHNGNGLQAISEGLLAFIPGHFGSSVPLTGVEEFLATLSQAWIAQQEAFSSDE